MQQKTIITLCCFVFLLGTIEYTRIYVRVEINDAKNATTEKEIREIKEEPWEKVNSRRKASIQNYCRKVGKRVPEKLNSSLWKTKAFDKKPRLFYSDSAGLLYCETPKCGTTQWRNLLLILDGHLDGYTAGSGKYFEMAWKYNLLWKSSKRRNAKEVASIDRRLQDYAKLMVTREPLERLVSAYKDKLETGKNPFYVSVSRMIHRKMNGKPVKGFATFEEFIDFILATKIRANLDPHWKPYSDLCDPCNIEYDFIARLETIYNDATYITGNIGVARDRIFSEAPNATLQERRVSLYHDYFNKIPLSKRNAIFKYYKDQYDMFGYAYPNFINTSDVSGT